jgi:rod shape-determining protein MreD
MKYGRALMVLLLLSTAVVIQTVVLTRIPFPAATPDLVVIVVAALAMVEGPTYGAVVGFVGGLMLDVVPPGDGAVGRWALVLCLVGWFAGRASDAVEGSTVLPLLVVVASCAAALVGYAVVGWLIGDVRVSGSDALHAIPAALLYDILLSPFVVPGVMALARRFEVTTTYARTIR